MISSLSFATVRDFRIRKTEPTTAPCSCTTRPMSPGRGRRKRMDFLRISRIDQDTRIEAIIRAQDSIREGDHASMSGTSAEHFGIGQPVSRFEDPRLLRGEGRYINDLVLPGMAHLAYVRSPHPPARIV